jgi:uncharacterized protein
LPVFTTADLSDCMHLLLWPVWNEAERRVRVGWRLLLQLTLYLFGPPLLYQAVDPALSQWVARLAPTLAPLAARIASFGVRFAVILVGTWLVVRWVDRRRWRDMGLQLDRSWWADLVFGLLLGALLMTFVFVVQWSAGWIAVRRTFAVDEPGVSFAVAILGPLIVFVVVGFTEELLSRGYQLRNLAEGFHAAEPTSGRTPQVAVIGAWVLSSSLFGLLHIFNPNATWLSTVYLMLAGLLLGLGIVLTGRLGLPIGLHIAWNFWQGSVYGFPVSGNDFTSVTVIAIEQGGPELWTGGAFGPEAGLIGIAAILLGCALTLGWVRARYGAIRLAAGLAIYQPRHAAPAVQTAHTPQTVE